MEKNFVIYVARVFDSAENPLDITPLVLPVPSNLVSVLEKYAANCGFRLDRLHPFEIDLRKGMMIRAYAWRDNRYERIEIYKCLPIFLE